MTAESAEFLDYTSATDRLKEFVSVEVGWDGHGGLPASSGAAADVARFLEVAQRAQIQVPVLAMGGDGSVAVVWTEDDVYITADFDGTGSYSFFVSKGDKLLCEGQEQVGTMAPDLHPYLVASFGRVACWQKV